ncbi:MAG: hypothetical protein ACPGGA_11010 [Balneolaceae bacterium]
MLARIGRIIASLFGAAGVAAAPVKTISTVIIPMIFTYLLYAFLGGFGIALAIVGIGWAIWYFAKKK